MGIVSLARAECSEFSDAAIRERNRFIEAIAAERASPFVSIDERDNPSVPLGLDRGSRRGGFSDHFSARGCLSDVQARGGKKTNGGRGLK